MKYKNYRNSYTNEDKIYSKKNIADMSVREAFSRKDEIMAQHNSIGIPSEGELQSSPNAVWVDAYTRDDGTEVKGYWRRRPEGSVSSAIDNEVKNNTQNEDERGNVTGGASEVKNMNTSEKIQEYAYEKGLNKIFPMSSGATVHGMHDMEAAKKDKNATVTNGLDAIESQKNREYLKAMGAKEDDSGVIYNEHSDIAINFKNSPELEKHITDISDDVMQGKNLQDCKITFDSKREDFKNNREKIDRHAFIHDALIVDQKVDDNGVYTCKILDYSNFDDKPVEKFKGRCIAVIHRTNDNDDKLIVVPIDKNYSDDAIEALVEFQEEHFKHVLIRT